VQISHENVSILVIMHLRMTADEDDGSSGDDSDDDSVSGRDGGAPNHATGGGPAATTTPVPPHVGQSTLTRSVSGSLSRSVSAVDA
jgi:hypothetical protein